MIQIHGGCVCMCVHGGGVAVVLAVLPISNSCLNDGIFTADG